MKAIVLSLGLIFGSVMFVGAQTVNDDTKGITQQEVVAVAQEPVEWEEVKMENCNEKVQVAIKTLEESYNVKTIAFNKTTNQTKVSLVSKADATEKSVILNEEGEEAKK